MWPVTLSGRLPVVGSVGLHPADYLIGRDPIPRHRSFPAPPCGDAEHPALPPVSRSYSGPRGRSVTHYSPVRRSHPGASTGDPARLACVKHAASARPEPESNSPQKNTERTIMALKKKKSGRKKQPPRKAAAPHEKPRTRDQSKRKERMRTGIKRHKKVAQSTLSSSPPAHPEGHPPTKTRKRRPTGSKKQTYTTGSRRTRVKSKDRGIQQPHRRAATNVNGHVRTSQAWQ